MDRFDAKAILVGLGVVAVIALGSWAARELTSSDSKEPTVAPAQQVLVLINKIRVSHKLVPVKRDLVLASLARGHVKNMRSRGFFAHDDPQGQTFAERMAYLKRRQTGEVQAYGSGGFGTPKGLVDLWMASPGHRRVLMTPSMRRMGCSVIIGPFLGHSGITLSVCDLSS